MKIYIGIATYNRLDILKRMAKSLYAIDGIDTCCINVFDDASTEYNKKDLQDIFLGAGIIVNNENIGPDKNTAKMYEAFIKSDADIFLNADSDMLFCNNTIEFIIKNLVNTDGVLGLYNSCRHKSRQNVFLENINFVVKNDVGAAGVVFSRKMLSEILDNVTVTRSFDWDWSRYLQTIGKKIYVVKESLAQHIGGINGANSYKYKFDFGLGFNPQDTINRGLLLDYLIDMKASKTLWKRHYKWIKYQLKIMGLL